MTYSFVSQLVCDSLRPFFNMGLVGWCNRVKRLEDFFKKLGCVLDIWHPTSGECAAF